LSGLIASPDLVDRVHEIACKMLQDRQRSEASEPDARQQLRKLEQDLEVWYGRHDAARSDLERQAAWHRIVQLTERREKMAQEAAQGPSRPLPKAVQVSRQQVARYLENLAGAMSQAADEGKALVQALVENHGLAVVMKDSRTLVIRLALRPPGADGPEAEEHLVRLQADAEMAKDRVSAWVDEHQGQHSCKECGQPIKVERRHFWRGIPRYHHGCCMRDVLQRRMAPAQGFYTGQQAADRLGIGRTTLNRWLRQGKVPKPAKVLRTMLLFERKGIDSLARKLGR
jgi:hypothetical protein